MINPKRPIERIPPSEFRPPHCPWPACPDHHLDRSRQYRSVRNGFYKRKCDRRRIQRFLCRRCDRGFSQQTFSVTYYMKRPELLIEAATWMTSGTPLRRIARGVHHVRAVPPCSPSSIVRISRRIGSQCGLALDELSQFMAGISEPIVFDHFETFVGSQENAIGVATPVGKMSRYTYGLEPAWHRQATAGSRKQRRVSATPGAYRRSVKRMLEILTAKTPPKEPLRLISDDHAEYGRAIANHDAPVKIERDVHPNPKQRRKGDKRTAEDRERNRAMSPANQLHRWFRHVGADHRRESISFCRRGEAALERLSAVVLAKNLIQGVSEKRDDKRTPAMLLGLTGRPWLWSEVLGRRRWPGRVGARATTREVLRRSMQDPRGIVWPEHVRKRSL